MRIIMIFIEFFIIGGLGFLVLSSLIALINSNQDKAAWDKWVKKEKENKDITEESLLEDIDTILKIAEKNVPPESVAFLLAIKENVEILKNSPKSLEQIKNSSPEDFFDLLNILHKYIPESLNKYFSIPEKMKKQEHRNGKNSHVLLNEALESLQGRFESITQNLVSEKINELKTYQTFINTRFK